MERILEFFILGVSLSFGPCFLFCSPAPLAYIAATKTRPWDGFISMVIFSSTRMLSHAVMGLIAGALGAVFTQVVQQWRGTVYQGGGILVALLGLSIIFMKQQRNPACAAAHKKFFNNGLAGMAALGLVTGVLPCLSLLSILILIVLYAQGWGQGFVYGLSFGAGGFISPLLILGIVMPLFPRLFVNHHKVFAIFTGVCGLILFAVGVRLFFLGLS